MNASRRTAVAVEVRKARSSRVLWATGLLLALGTTLLATVTIRAARSGSVEIAAKLGPHALAGDWPALLAISTQVTGAASVLAFGVGISWLYGREFADGTVSGLFGLPVSKGSIATAKLAVYLVWAALVSALLVLLVLGAGLALGLGFPHLQSAVGLGRLLALGLLSALLAVPAGWAASIGRGLLPGIAVSVGILVVAQVGALAHAGGWLPFVTPALWAIEPNPSSALALLGVPVVPLLFGTAVVLAWRRIQLDR